MTCVAAPPEWMATVRSMPNIQPGANGVRTVVINGVEVAESARAMMTSNVKIEIVEGCGHFLQVERPDIVNARILEFLS